jgi:hypothetical protein
VCGLLDHSHVYALVGQPAIRARIQRVIYQANVFPEATDGMRVENIKRNQFVTAVDFSATRGDLNRPNAEGPNMVGAKSWKVFQGLRK